MNESFAENKKSENEFALCVERCQHSTSSSVEVITDVCSFELDTCDSFLFSPIPLSKQTGFLSRGGEFFNKIESHSRFPLKSKPNENISESKSGREKLATSCWAGCDLHKVVEKEASKIWIRL